MARLIYETPARCPEGQRLGLEWVSDFLAASSAEARHTVFVGKRPYDIHVETCVQCSAYEKWVGSGIQDRRRHG